MRKEAPFAKSPKNPNGAGAQPDLDAAGNYRVHGLADARGCDNVQVDITLLEDTLLPRTGMALSQLPG
jgi:hypothetical protein